MKFTLAAAFSLIALPALAQTAPDHPTKSAPLAVAPSKEQAVLAAWNQNLADLATAEQNLRARLQLDKQGTEQWARDQLESELIVLQQQDMQASLKALQAWIAEQKQRMADQEKDASAKLSAVQKDRQGLTRQIEALNERISDPKNQTDKVKIAELNQQLSALQRQCAPNVFYGSAPTSGANPSFRPVAPSDLPPKMSWPSNGKSGP